MFGSFKVGIMGTGKIAGIMADTIKGMKGVSCYAVGSRALESAERFASEHGVKKAYGSYAELVSDPKIELIYVATPHSEHFENVKLALSAGKNVICEKAFMLNEKQAREVFEIAEKNNLLLTEAMWTRYSPMRAKLSEVLASNVIGDATMLSANLGYNVSAKDRIAKPELGGGALLDLGVYVLNFASMTFGDDVTDIMSICTYNEFGMDMQDSITLRYRNGKVAVLNATALSYTDRNAVIYGTKGYIVVENINNIEGIAVFDSEHKKLAYYKAPRQITGYEYEIQACMKAIDEKWIECPDMPHAQTLKMLNMMDFIRKNNNIKFPGDDPAIAGYESTSAHVEDAYATEAPAIDAGVVSAAFVETAEPVEAVESVEAAELGAVPENSESVSEDNIG